MQPYHSTAGFPTRGPAVEDRDTSAAEKALHISQKAGKNHYPHITEGEMTRVAYSAAKSQSVK